MSYANEGYRASPARGFAWGTGFAIGATACFGVIVGALALFNMASVDKGEIGVYSVRPMIFGKGGVPDEIVIGPSRAYMAPTTALERLKISPESIVVHADDFMSKDRVPLDFDVSITLQLGETAKAPEMYRKFGGNHIETFKTLVLQNSEKKTGAAGEFMSFLRDQIRHHHSAVFVNAQDENGLASDGAKKVEEATTNYINKFLEERGAGMVKVTNIALGRANPPPGVRQSIERTAEQAQEQKTQVEREKAANQRKAAEIATAGADMAYVNAMGLSGDQFVDLKRIEAIRSVCGVNLSGCVLSFGGNTPVAVSAGQSTAPKSTIRASVDGK
jgi:hypothetical protein